MVAFVVPQRQAGPMVRALKLGNSLAAQFAQVDALQAPMPYQTTDGLFVAGGADGFTSPSFAKLIPFGEGSPGDSFSMRIYGWETYVFGGQTAQNVEIPLFLAEFYCTICSRTGTGGWMLSSERFCDTITLTQGSLGMGWINATGVADQRTGLIAYIQLDLNGCRFFSFDFQQESPGNIGMNCFVGTM